MSSNAALPDHRNTLWNTMLTAEMNVCYWTWISDRYTKWDSRLKFFIALTASGTVAGWSIWSQMPELWKILSAVSAIASIAHPFFFPSEKLKRMSGLVATWKEIAMNCVLLWEKDDRLKSPDSWREFEVTKHREASVDETDLPKNSRLLKQAFERV